MHSACLRPRTKRVDRSLSHGVSWRFIGSGFGVQGVGFRAV